MANPVGLITGVRASESDRRMGFVKPLHIEKNRWAWTAAIADYSSADCYAEIERACIPLNPVAVHLCKSGECYCGGFGTGGELEELTLYDFSRDFGYWMLDLQRRVFAEMNRKFGIGWKWHERKPRTLTRDSPGQMHLPGMMCYSCGAAATKRSLPTEKGR